MSGNMFLRRVLPITAAVAVAFGTGVAATGFVGADEADKNPSNEYTDQIVGGAPVEEELPWIAALHAGEDFRCTSSQISAEWILTAAHCVEEGDEFNVRIGSLERSAGGEERDVAEVVMHPEFDWPDNDIALLRMTEGYENTYAPMATEADVELGQESMIYGWGSENEDWSGPLPENLKYSVGNTTEEMCDFNDVVCMMGDGGVAGGDSGGPGFVKSPETGEFVQVGVCAIGHNPADSNWSGYTSIPANADWIAEVTGV